MSGAREYNFVHTGRLDLAQYGFKKILFVIIVIFSCSLDSQKTVIEIGEIKTFFKAILR